jgi:amidase
MNAPVFAAATRLAALIKSKELSSVEVLEAYLSRIAAENPAINALSCHDPELGLARAREIDRRLAAGENVGPLAGVPMTVKDLYEAEGLLCSSGTTGRIGHRPARDATAIARLRAAGAVVFGKSNVPEFGLALESTNLVSGTSCNPYDLSRTPGGSSGGAAAALAAGFSALEFGSDGGGSIRIPAHFCGVAGFKPTSYRVSKAGHFPRHTGVASRMGGHGPLARSVADLRLAFDLVVGEDPLDPDALPKGLGLSRSVPTKQLRVAYYADNGICAPSPETAKTIENCALALRDRGASVEAVRLPMLQEAFDIHLGLLIIDRALIREWKELAGTSELHPWVQSGLEYLDDAASDFDSTTATLLNDDWWTFRREATQFMQNYDVILSPVAPGPALPHGEMTDSDHFDWTSYACTHNVSGFPAVTLRCGTSNEGLPIGVEIAGKAFDDELVLEVASLLEQDLGGFVPPSRAG